MISRRVLLLGGAGTLGGLAGARLAWASFADSGSRQQAPLPSPSILLDGDLVFRRGVGLESQVILGQENDSRFSHVGVIVKMVDGQANVVHALPRSDTSAGGALVESLSDFGSQNNASRVAIYRLVGLSEQERAKVRAATVSMIGVKFNDAFALSDRSRVYCTQLALQALEAARPGIGNQVLRTPVILASEPVVLPESLARWISMAFVF